VRRNAFGSQVDSAEVHLDTTLGPAEVAFIRAPRVERVGPGVEVLAHPECPRPVVEAADFAGSTAQMQDYVEKRKPLKVALITECSMSDNVAQSNPDVDFVRPCNLCPYMKLNTLAKIRHSLETMTTQVEIDPEVAERARAAVDRMLQVGPPPKAAPTASETKKAGK